MKLWQLEGRDIVFRTPIFTIRRDRKRRSDVDESARKFYVLDSVDWVNVLPVTSNDEAILIELHRHGTDEISLEVPGGMVDPEDASPAAAGAREMKEETGYGSDELIELGVVHPNPAIQSNRCFSFLAPNARLVGDPDPDETEDIEVVRVPVAELPSLVREGKITHSLVLNCLSWYFQSRE